MWGWSKKRFLLTLVLSVVVWYGSVVLQVLTGFNNPLSSFFSGQVCKPTGFPIATCVYYAGKGGVSVWMINLVNILLWFWVIHLLWGWFGKQKS